VASRTIWKSLIGAIAGASVTLANFFSGVVVARMLGVGPTGTVSYIVWLSLMIAPVADLGMAATVERFGAELRGQGARVQADMLAARLLKTLASALLVVAVLTVALTLLPDGWKWLGIPDAQFATGGASPRLFPLLIAAFVIVQVLGTFSYAFLRSSQSFGAAARLAATSLLLQVCGVAFGGAVFGAPGAVAGYVAGMLLPAAITLKIIRQTTAIESEFSRRVGRYARYIWVANVANAFVWSRIEVFFLAHYWGGHAVALFAVAMTLTNLATQGPILLTGAALPILSERRGRNDDEGMRAIYLSGTRVLALLVFPACLGMAAVMPVLVPLIYGDAFTAAVPAATILVSVAAISATSIISTNVVYASERSDVACLTAVAGAAISVVVGFALVPRFGLIGAVIGRTVIQLLMVALGSWFVVSRLHYPLPVRELYRLSIAALLSAVVARLLVLAVPHAAILLVAIPASVGVYVVALRMLKALPSSDIAFLSNFARSLPVPLSRAADGVVRFIGYPAVP
jgi:O-antigen/teichoic acid export membrane protein